MASENYNGQRQELTGLEASVSLYAISHSTVHLLMENLDTFR